MCTSGGCEWSLALRVVRQAAGAIDPREAGEIVGGPWADWERGGQAPQRNRRARLAAFALVVQELTGRTDPELAWLAGRCDPAPQVLEAVRQAYLEWWHRRAATGSHQHQAVPLGGRPEWFVRADLAMRAGQWEDAVAAIWPHRQAILANPDDLLQAQALNWLGAALIHLGRTADAFDALQGASAAMGRVEGEVDLRTRVRINLAYALLDLGGPKRIKEAHDSLSMQLVLCQAHPDAYSEGTRELVFWALAEWGSLQEDEPVAAQALTLLRQLRPDSDDPEAELGAALLREERLWWIRARTAFARVYPTLAAAGARSPVLERAAARLPILAALLFAAALALGSLVLRVHPQTASRTGGAGAAATQVAIHRTGSVAREALHRTGEDLELAQHRTGQGPAQVEPGAQGAELAIHRTGREALARHRTGQASELAWHRTGRSAEPGVA